MSGGEGGAEQLLKNPKPVNRMSFGSPGLWRNKVKGPGPGGRGSGVGGGKASLSVFGRWVWMQSLSSAGTLSWMPPHSPHCSNKRPFPSQSETVPSLPPFPPGFSPQTLAHWRY